MANNIARISLLILFASSGSFVFAQSAPTEETSLSLTQTVEPSFRIEPIVHRFSGRRGEVIPFEFTITSLGKPMNLKVTPVNLRQEESGVILHDQASPPSDAIALTSPQEFQLGPGESSNIVGSITIPTAKTNYLSFGILVQDRGQAPNYEGVEGRRSTTKAGIRFVTQYVLRVDLETGNADPREFGSLRLEEGKIVSNRGLPLVRAYLDNPTDFAFECQVRATIKSPASGKPRPFLLGMPSRSALDGDDRFLVRIMPKSRLRLETVVESPIFPGSQTLNLGLSNGRREVVGAEFELSLAPGSFPGLKSQIAYIGDRLAVSPSQISVGTTSGATRMLGLKFINNSPIDQQILLNAKNLAGEEIKGLKISPRKFTLRAGRSKNVRVQTHSLSGSPKSSMGEILIEAYGNDGKPALQALPLIVRRTERKVPNLLISDIQFVNHSKQAGFQLTVQNNGQDFVPIDAELELTDSQGRSMRMSSGYGKWIRPGQVEKLVFTPETSLPGGEYLLSLAVKTYEDQPAITKSLAIRLKAHPENESSQSTSTKNDNARLNQRGHR